MGMYCHSQNTILNSEIKERITKVERGLTAFTSPKDMLDAVEENGKEKLTINDRMKHYNVPGVSISVINDYKIEWSKAYGVTNNKKANKVMLSTYFQAASTSKLIVAAIVLKLVDEKVLNLDDDVNNVLLSWKIPESEFLKKEKVTLRRLLTHQSGLNRPDGGFSYDGNPSLVELLVGGDNVHHDPAAIEFEPGSKWQYSNFGYMVIELILEDVLGRDFSEIAQEFVFNPLKMNSSTYNNTIIRENEILPHDAEGEPHNPVLHPTVVAHGGLITTPSDLSLFAMELIKSHKGKSNKLISQKMASLMFTKQAALSPDMFGLPIGEGMGTLIRGTNFSSFFHPGDNFPGATCWLVGFQELGKGAVIMTNGAQGSLLTMEIIYSITTEYNWPTNN